MVSADRLEGEYRASRPRSSSLHEEARRYFAAAGATHSVRVFQPFRPYVTHAEGARKWDVDGNEYVDYSMGHGALILGHSHPAVVTAVQQQASRGLHYGENHQMEVEWAKLIHRMMPVAERVEFCATGQEANLMAVRLARIYTGRRRILRFTHNYHGWADELAALGGAGCVADCVTEIPLNDSVSLERELATGDYALLLSEGGGARMAGRAPIALEFQRSLPGVAHNYGTLYCLDEVVTGFRDAPGGWQELAGVVPDLATVGKCAGGGLLVGAVVGRADLFAALDPGAPPHRSIHHAGTWNANPLSAAAGIAACSLYVDGGPQQQARTMARLLRDGANEVFRRKRVWGSFYGRSVVHLYLGRPERDSFDADFEAPCSDATTLMDQRYAAVVRRMNLHLLQRGVASLGGSMFVLSAAHTERDVAVTLDGLESSLEAMIVEGAIPADLTVA